MLVLFIVSHISFAVFNISWLGILFCGGKQIEDGFLDVLAQILASCLSIISEDLSNLNLFW